MVRQANSHFWHTDDSVKSHTPTGALACKNGTHSCNFKINSHCSSHTVTGGRCGKTAEDGEMGAGWWDSGNDVKALSQHAKQTSNIKVRGEKKNPSEEEQAREREKWYLYLTKREQRKEVQSCRRQELQKTGRRAMELWQGTVREGKQGGAGTGRQWLEGENQKENKNISKVKMCFEKRNKNVEEQYHSSFWKINKKKH